MVGRGPWGVGRIRVGIGVGPRPMKTCLRGLEKKPKKPRKMDAGGAVRRLALRCSCERENLEREGDTIRVGETNESSGRTMTRWIAECRADGAWTLLPPLEPA